MKVSNLLRVAAVPALALVSACAQQSSPAVRDGGNPTLEVASPLENDRYADLLYGLLGLAGEELGSAYSYELPERPREGEEISPLVVPDLEAYKAKHPDFEYFEPINDFGSFPFPDSLFVQGAYYISVTRIPYSPSSNIVYEDGFNIILFDAYDSSGYPHFPAVLFSNAGRHEEDEGQGLPLLFDFAFYDEAHYDPRRDFRAEGGPGVDDPELGAEIARQGCSLASAGLLVGAADPLPYDFVLESWAAADRGFRLDWVDWALGSLYVPSVQLVSGVGLQSRLHPRTDDFVDMYSGNVLSFRDDILYEIDLSGLRAGEGFSATALAEEPFSPIWRGEDLAFEEGETYLEYICWGDTACPQGPALSFTAQEDGVYSFRVGQRSPETRVLLFPEGEKPIGEPSLSKAGYLYPRTGGHQEDVDPYVDFYLEAGERVYIEAPIEPAFDGYYYLFSLYKGSSDHERAGHQWRLENGELVCWCGATASSPAGLTTALLSDLCTVH